MPTTAERLDPKSPHYDAKFAALRARVVADLAEIKAAIGNNEQRVRDAFADRPMLEVQIQQQSNGLWCAYVGKFGQMRRFVTGKASPTEVADAVIAKLNKQ